LVGLLRQPPPRSDRPTAKHQQLWNAVSKRWVVTVLGVSTLGFFAWLPFAGPQQALNVAVALLVITCPCAVGIAIPLAYELMQSRLRCAGFYSRAPDVLDRLTDVKKLVFDKTGTLTMGRLELVNPEVVELLSPEAREVAWNLAVRSSHPVSVAISRAFEGAKWRADAEVVEVAGKGVEWKRADGVWRMGRGDWASNGEQSEGTLLTRNGVALATLTTREVMRGDAKVELERLTNRGYQLSLLSGDSMARAQRLAGVLGIPLSRAQGALSPEQKAEQVRALGAEDVLFLGDGVNDALAFQAAMVAGTPAIDRPVMPSKSDFFLVGEGLSSLSIALDGAQELRRVVRRILALSLGYNVLAITVALFGFMSPVAAAISMPASTLTLLAFTVTALGRPRRTSVEARRTWIPHPA
jgi:Cu2+-exporting ATPase